MFLAEMQLFWRKHCILTPCVRAILVLYYRYEQRKDVKISVRNLVEFVFREGDIVSGGAGVRNVEAMQLGSRIHRKIQKSMGVGYDPEVPLFTIQKFKSAEYEEEFFLEN